MKYGESYPMQTINKEALAIEQAMQEEAGYLKRLAKLESGSAKLVYGSEIPTDDLIFAPSIG